MNRLVRERIRPPVFRVDSSTLAVTKPPKRSRWGISREISSLIALESVLLNLAWQGVW